MPKFSLQFFIFLSITLYSFNSYSIPIPACDTAECKSYFKQYKKYSKAGYSDAMTTLGDLYLSGHGTDKNAKRALKEYKKGAKYGSVNGQFKAGMMYLNHEDFKDIPKGVKYLEKSARNMSQDAAFLLGVIYFKEDFYERDYSKSDKWLTKAYQANHKNAVSFIRLIEESHELNQNNYPNLLAAIEDKPLPVIKIAEEEIEKTQVASAQKQNEAHESGAQQQPTHQNAQPPKDDKTEVITVTTTLHEMFAAQLDSLKGTYPQKGDVGTGSKIIGRTCDKMVSCGIGDKDDFDRLLASIIGVSAADAFRSF